MILVLLLASCISGQITITGPSAASTGTSPIPISLSSFGSAFSYKTETRLSLILPAEDNVFGCSRIDSRQGRFAILVKQGECTFSKKAFVAQIAGATAVVVFDERSSDDISSITPVSDSICWLTRPECEDSHRAGVEKRRTFAG